MKTSAAAGVLSAVIAMFFAGCSESPVSVTSQASAAEFVNARCPIMGGEIHADEVDPASVREWNGKKIAFCCPPCIEEWDALTDAEKAEHLAHPPEN